MSPAKTPFTALYMQWLDSFRALIPGAVAKAPAAPTPKQEEVAAKQEWEDEGGSIKPPSKEQGAEPVPKLPL